MILRVEDERVRHRIGAVQRTQGLFQLQGKPGLRPGTGVEDMNPARRGTDRDSLAVGTRCNVTDQGIQRIFRAVVSNHLLEPAFRCVPYACMTLPRGNQNRFAVVAPHADARRMLLTPDSDRQVAVVLGTIREIFAQLANRGGRQDQPKWTGADIYPLSIRAPSERHDPSGPGSDRVNELARARVVEQQIVMYSRREQPARRGKTESEYLLCEPGGDLDSS